MADVNITYKGASIATMGASGTKTLETSGKYCEDDITIEYVAPTTPTKPTQPLYVTENGTYTAPSGTAYTPVTVNVPTGGVSGYAKKTGSFVLSSDYTYAERADRTYLGNILIETGLSHIYSLIVWSEEWAAGEATANCFGLSMAFPDNPPTDTNVANACHYYSGYSIMRNGTNNLAASFAQGVFFHSMSSNISEGSFGLRCHSASFPIRAGQTIRWEACGEE